LKILVKMLKFELKLWIKEGGMVPKKYTNIIVKKKVLEAMCYLLRSTTILCNKR
jgi:hypothetical protein